MGLGKGSTATDRSRTAADELISSSFGILYKEEADSKEIDGARMEAVNGLDTAAAKDTNLNYGDNVRSQAEDDLAYVPNIFEFAVRNAFTNKQRLAISESSWINELFKALCGLVGADLEEPTKSNITEPASNILDRLLEILHSFNHSPGAATLETMLTSLCGLGNTQKKPHWKRARLCIEIDYRVILDSTHQQSDSRQTQSALQELIETISVIDKRPQSSDLEGSTTRSNILQLLGCVMDAFIKSRSFSRFLTLWERRITTHFESIFDLDLDTAGRMVWDGQELYRMMIRKLESANIPAQRLIMLETRLRHLQTAISTAMNVREIYATLFVSSCLFESLARSDNFELPASAVSNYHYLLIFYKKTLAPYPRYGQVLWSLLASLYEEYPQFLIEDHRSHSLLELCESALVNVKSCLDFKGTVATFERGLSSAQFLAQIWLTSSKSMDPANSTGLLLPLFTEMVQSFTACLFHIDPKPSKDGFWSGIEYSVTSNTHFILAGCILIVLRASSLEYDSSLSTSFHA